jgi:D-aminopeptidase
MVSGDPGVDAGRRARLAWIGMMQTKEAEHCREEAVTCLSAMSAKRFSKEARQSAVAAHIDEWVSSPCLQPPE